ncbi:N-acyl amino acid synthase FeeM domain-containing protein [Rhizosaccharibacter radicis]|uniref:N-acyl amino acid synthase FeeM catalytic core domain-containing protein n=1 Tax=Rhizosaccharibacter radicis TaxID=2782605 RepID=A0ABT1W2R2_9PROT|nr:hypothetical protein [Acetobacteraceae bacterium KSS12]
MARLATDERTRRDMFRLRYLSYLRSGFIQPHPSETFSDSYDDLPNSRSFVIYENGEPVASARACLLAHGSGLRSPAFDTFPAEVAQLLRQGGAPGFGQRGIETTRLVRSPRAENNQGLVFLLIRLASYIGMMSHAQLHIACVRTHHLPFYKRLGYRPMTEPKPYPGLSCPMLLAASTRERFDEVRAAFPLVDPFAGNRDELDGFLAGVPVPMALRRS